jgi:cbb3-type cytochrome oxidase subunit 3
VSDHYFYLLYSFVTMGVVSVFAWDLLFPDLLDLFVLTPLPIASMRLFQSRIVAACLYLGLFLFGTSAVGAIFFPLMAEPPQFTRHVFAHLVAVLAAGAFAGASILSLQGLLLAVMGERWFRAVAPFLQALVVMMLLSILLLFPVMAQFLQVLSNLPAARYFPPFWFLGIYETLLTGSSSLPVFREFAATGCMALAVVLVLVIVSYPLAYRRRMRYLVEESGALDTRTLAAAPIDRVLHASLLRNRVQRGVYHFITHSLLRTQRHRVYLAMYGGLGLALLLASTVLLKLTPGHLGFELSPDGLRAAVPIVAFWTITGLRTAFVSPADKRGSWIFRVILGRPGVEQLDATERWILPFTIVLSLGMVALVATIAPPALQGWRPILSQALVGIGLSLLLTDVLFLAVRSIPFTGGERASGTNLAFILLQYFGLFPPLILLMVDLEPWLEASLWHVAGALGLIAGAHIAMRRAHKKNAAYHANLIDLDDDEEEFPQRLGLRY